MATLTFGGQDIRTRGDIFLDLVKGYWDPADVRGKDDDIPAATGRTVRNRVRSVRYISLSGWVDGTSASDFNANMAALFAVMVPDDAPGALVIGDGYLGTTGTPTINARFLNAVIDYRQKGDGTGSVHATVDIEMESVDPDWT